MDPLYRFVVRRRRELIVVLALATAFFAWHAREIRFDGSVESLLPADDPSSRYYAEVRATFGILCSYYYHDSFFCLRLRLIE
jgi:predicted RND superfamily exporter protein